MWVLTIPLDTGARVRACDVRWCVRWCGVRWCGVRWCNQRFVGSNFRTALNRRTFALSDAPPHRRTAAPSHRRTVLFQPSTVEDRASIVVVERRRLRPAERCSRAVCVPESLDIRGPRRPADDSGIRRASRGPRRGTARSPRETVGQILPRCSGALRPLRPEADRGTASRASRAGGRPLGRFRVSARRPVANTSAHGSVAPLPPVHSMHAASRW